MIRSRIVSAMIVGVARRSTGGRSEKVIEASLEKSVFEC